MLCGHACYSSVRRRRVIQQRNVLLYVLYSAGGLCGGCAVEQGFKELESQSLGWTVFSTLPPQGEWSEQTRGPWAYHSMTEESTQTQESSFCD